MPQIERRRRRSTNVAMLRQQRAKEGIAIAEVLGKAKIREKHFKEACKTLQKTIYGGYL